VALFVVLAALSVAAFAVTRAARSADDLVNTVVLTKKLPPGGEATVSFVLAEPDSDVDVQIIEGGSERRVRALATGKRLGAGRQRLTWDGTTDRDKPAPPGLYAIRVILGEQDRDILPPGRIRVLEPAMGAPGGGTEGRKKSPPGKNRPRGGGKG
jgi:flagellar hook assembly protein FlgD